MTFADWKKTSKLFRIFRDRADNYGIGLSECCQAAYKAGEREGRKHAEEMARHAIVLRELARDIPRQQAMSLNEQVVSAQREIASWSKDRRQNVQLEGGA